jgi:hypothetical protein
MRTHQVRSYGLVVTTDDRTPEPTDGTPTVAHTPAQYEIRVKGHLGPRWSAWLDGLSLTTDANGSTVIRGPVVDQAALHGLLQRLRDVGIPLVSLTQLPADTAHAPQAPRTHEGN